ACWLPRLCACGICQICENAITRPAKIIGDGRINYMFDKITMYVGVFAKICKEGRIDAVSNIFPFFKRNDKFRQALFLVIGINDVNLFIAGDNENVQEDQENKGGKKRYSHKMAKKFLGTNSDLKLQTKSGGS